jgi:hypothetical protein
LRTFDYIFGTNAYDDLPSMLSLRGYINSFGTGAYFIFLDHFGLKG